MINVFQQIRNSVLLRKVFFLVLYCIVISGILFYAHTTEIRQCSVDNKSIISLPFEKKFEGKRSYEFSCNIYSNIEYSKIFSIVIDDRIESITLNNKSLNLALIKEQYQQKELLDYAFGYQFTLDLKKENKIIIQGTNLGGNLFFDMVQGVSVLEYCVLFIFFIFPFLYLLYILFFAMLKIKLNFKVERIYSIESVMLIMVILAIIVRIYLLITLENDMLQHDYKGHQDAIIYFAQYPFSFPQVDKSLQFPQQNLYYLISGGIYNIVHYQFKFDVNTAFFMIRIFSVIYSILFLVIGYKLISQLTNHSLSKVVFMGFIGFTPSLVFMSQRVNNDSLNMLLGIASILLIIMYYKKPTFERFLLTIYLIILAILTKISSLLFAIVFFIVLLYHFFKFKQKVFIYSTQKRVFIFCLLICFIFGLALIRVYIPSINEFRFVNSTLYLGQVIPSLDFSYFFSFNIFDLIQEGQSYVFGDNEIRFSFPTYQYGTMLTGEYQYSQFFKEGTVFKLLTQLIYFLGLFYIIGFFYYLYSFYQFNFVQKLMIFFLIINLGLIIKFLFSYWSICNSDFRYYSPVFGAIGVIFSLGLERIMLKYPKIISKVMLSVFLLHLVEFFWLIQIGMLF